MKKVILFLFVSAAVFSFIQCSSMDPKVMACKAGCDSAFDKCVKEAGESNAKKAACEAAKTRCYNDCDKQ